VNINPKAAGLSPARLATLDRFVQTRYIDAGKIAGALTVIARRGEVAHFSPLGLADVERKTPVREAYYLPALLDDEATYQRRLHDLS